jgi:uncharacterized protein YecE (DUF72 family)
MPGRVHIGTSGWHYKHWVGLFYPEGIVPSEMLPFYLRQFDTVEVNNTFYQLPALSTFDSWRENSSKEFLFAIKASRFITHMKKLKEPESSVQKFFSRTEALQEKLGPVLFQLPPRWKLNRDRLAEFLGALPNHHRYVFEFRDDSWLVPQVFDLLAEYNAALCIHDLGTMKTPIEITATFTYVRFHGPGSAKYSGSYSDRELQEWAGRINEWRKRLSAVYVYFNNDVGGCAVRNAAHLKRMVLSGV